jgi:hypothetical protein
VSLLSFLAEANLPAVSLTDVTARSTTAPFYSLLSDGSGSYSRIGGTTVFTWRNSGLSTDYQVRATVDGVVGGWLSLGATRTWNTGTTIFLEIRAVANPSIILATGTVTLEFVS